MNRGTFALSQKELQRVAVISRCVKGELACARAAGLLCLSVRQRLATKLAAPSFDAHLEYTVCTRSQYHLSLSVRPPRKSAGQVILHVEANVQRLLVVVSLEFFPVEFDSLSVLLRQNGFGELTGHLRY